MKTRVRAILVLAAVTVAGALPLQAQEQIKYVGSSTVGMFMHEAAALYQGATFDIDTRPESGGGEIATARDMTDLGGVARDVKPEILEQDVRPVLIGKDAIGVWVHPDNPVQDLSREQLAGIFSGGIDNWSEVGGAVRSVTPAPAIIDKVAADPHGIGQLSFTLGGSHPHADTVRKIAVGGQAPTVRNPDYPITRPLYLITKGAPSAAEQAFLDWTVSPEGQAVVMKHFVGIGAAPSL